MSNTTNLMSLTLWGVMDLLENTMGVRDLSLEGYVHVTRALK